MDSIILTSVRTPSLPFRGQGLCGWVSLCCQLFGHLWVRVTGAKLAPQELLVAVAIRLLLAKDISEKSDQDLFLVENCSYMCVCVFSIAVHVLHWLAEQCGDIRFSRWCHPLCLTSFKRHYSTCETRTRETLCKFFTVFLLLLPFWEHRLLPF